MTADKYDAVAQLTATFVASLVELSTGTHTRPRSLLSSDIGDVLAYIPDDSARHYIATRSPEGSWSCLDLGCGNAPHRGMIESAGGRWTGCDYQASTDPATLARKGSTLEGRIVEYDGLQLPFIDESFDAVWSWQALEHVQQPERTFQEVSRVLRQGGVFYGSTSFLEPYHAQSTYSYTLYGFRLICERHGLKITELAPSADGLSHLIKRIGLILSLGDGSNLQDSFRKNKPLASLEQRLTLEHGDGAFVHALAQICGTFRFKAIRK